MSSIGILAYGSLIEEPGKELEPLVSERISNVQTPFSVEFARSSRSRGGAPTLVPVARGGAPVQAVILMLDATVNIERAEDLLWRRETRNESGGKHYNPTINPGPNSVIIKRLNDFHGAKAVLYTHIESNIKTLTPGHLADLAICSARDKACLPGRDGISYLSSVKRHGILTPLMREYEAAIFDKTGAKTLEEALEKIKHEDVVVWLDPEYWNDYFKRSFCRQITTFIDSIADRVLPTFDRIESEAEATAEQEWKRLCSLPGPEDSDMGYFAEQAQEAGIDYYLTLSAVHQSLINLTATALYHMFEQQVLLFHRKQVLRPAEKDCINLISMAEFKNRLGSMGISIEKFSIWTKVDELRVVANVVKHAEGTSAHALRSMRQDLFDHPSTRKHPLFNLKIGTRPVYLPLAGEDIFVTIDDLRAYGSALISFWEEFAEAIQATP
jgi:hypothetical protein